MPDRAPVPFRLIAIACGQVMATIAAALLASILFVSTDVAAEQPWLLGGLVAAVALSVWMRYRERVDGETYGQQMTHTIRMRLKDHLLRLPPMQRDINDGGVVLRFVSDLTALRNWYARGLVGLLVSLPVLAGGIGILVWLNWPMGLAVAACAGVAVATQLLAAPYLRSAGETARRERARLARSVTDASRTLVSVQLFGKSGAEGRRIARHSLALVKAMRYRAVWSGLLRAGSDAGASGLPVAVLVLWALSGDGNAGSASAALLLSGLLAPRLRELARIREYWELAGISKQRIAAFMARQTLDGRLEGKGLAKRQGRLALRGLTLPGVFANIAAEAPPGARIALTGPNGAGKSRLLAIIAGLEAPAAGRVVIDGQNVFARKLSALRRVVALASADAPLVRGSLDDNIRYGASAEGEEAARLMQLAGYEALAAELPRGGATRIGTGGTGLSAGQRARVMLLRALLRQPKLLLLDEIEANLDMAGQAVLRRVLAEFPGTVLMATHDPALQAACSEIWALGNGQLVVEAPAPVQTKDEDARYA